MELKEWVCRLFERNKLLIKLQRLCEQQQDSGAEGNSEDQQIKDWYPGNQIKVWWQQMTDENAIWGQGTERGGNGAEQGEIRRRSSDRREGGRHKPLFLCRWSLKDSERQLGCRLSLPVYTAHFEEGLLFFGGRSSMNQWLAVWLRRVELLRWCMDTWFLIGLCRSITVAPMRGACPPYSDVFVPLAGPLNGTESDDHHSVSLSLSTNKEKKST